MPPRLTSRWTGTAYGVFAHDWRLEPPLDWIERKGLIELSDGGAATTPGEASRPPLLVLSQPDFAAAVRQALRDTTRPQTLAVQPAAALATWWPSGPTVRPLQPRCRPCCTKRSRHYRANPKDDKFARALRRTYLEPAASQGLAAEALGLPFQYLPLPPHRRHRPSDRVAVAAGAARRGPRRHLTPRLRRGRNLTVF